MGWWEESGGSLEIPGFVKVPGPDPEACPPVVEIGRLSEHSRQWLQALAAEIEVDPHHIMEESILYVFERGGRVLEVIERVQGKWC